ncbi:MAG: hypothetical protein ACRDT9_04720, partial [Agromyces sp.]
MVPESNPARRRCSRVESTDGARRSPSSPHSSRSRRRGITAFGATIAATAVLATAPRTALAAPSARFVQAEARTGAGVV